MYLWSGIDGDRNADDSENMRVCMDSADWVQDNEKGSTVSKRTKRYSWIIGLLIFITVLLLGCISVKNIEKKRQQLLILHKVQ